MEKVIIIRYGEIFLKGKNRDQFESLLIKNIKFALKDIGATLLGDTEDTLLKILMRVCKKNLLNYFKRFLAYTL